MEARIEQRVRVYYSAAGRTPDAEALAQQVARETGFGLRVDDGSVAFVAMAPSWHIARAVVANVLYGIRGWDEHFVALLDEPEGGD
jgi:hypothetical protein